MTSAHLFPSQPSFQAFERTDRVLVAPKVTGICGSGASDLPLLAGQAADGPGQTFTTTLMVESATLSFENR